MPKFAENLVLFLFGGAVYSLLEVLFRGYTHWSMTIAGGVCLVLLYRHFAARPNEPLPLRCLFGAVTITLVEFAAGCIVNLWLGWHVWDYSGMVFNLFGQICLPFSIIWFFLTAPIVTICNFFYKKFAEM